MKVQLVSSPNEVQHAPSNAPQLKARAIEAFNKAGAPAPEAQAPAPTNHPQALNQNAIGAEDLSAIVPVQTTETQEPTQTPELDAPAPKAQPEDPALSRQFAQLARQERALRARVQQQEQAIRAREDAVKAKEAELTAKQPDLSKYIPKDRVKQDVLQALSDAGVSYDEVVQQLMNQTPKDPRVEATIGRLEAKIQVLEQQAEDSRKSYADNQTAAYQSAVKQIKTDVTNLVQHDPNFEAIKATRSVNDVVELITRTYEKDGTLLSVEEAAQQVEDYLTEEAMKLTRIGKIKSKLGLNSTQPTKPAQSQAAAAPKQQQQQMKTLTNATSSTRQLSAKERAILAFKGELKS